MQKEIESICGAEGITDDSLSGQWHDSKARRMKNRIFKSFERVPVRMILNKSFEDGILSNSQKCFDFLT